MRGAVLLLLSACSGGPGDAPPRDRAGPPACDTWYRDADGDGYGDPATAVVDCDARDGQVVDGTDCDDADAAVHPGAEEDCTVDADADCDDVNEYADVDADGWAACADCDDESPVVNPDAVEDCATAADDDCDGDPNPIDAPGCTDFIVDRDGDGAGSVLCLCDSTGYTTAISADDCDDANAALHPGAVEVWGNAVDEDCDGTADVVYAADTADAAFIAEGRSDRAGDALAGAGDLNADGYDDIVIGSAAPEGDDGFQPGVAYVLYGPASGERDVADADARLTGTSNDGVGEQAGFAVASAGDADGDGQSDLLVGAIYGGTAYEGAAHLLYGPVEGTVELAASDLTFTGADSNSYAGWTVARAGDQDGDGLDDVLVGAMRDDQARRAAGSVAVFSPARGSASWSSAYALFTGEASDDCAGSVAAPAGDVDGDGIPDLVIGAYGHDGRSGSLSGVAYIQYGPVSGTLSLAMADAKLVGESAGDLAGYAVAGAGDVDGDGRDEVLVGADGAGDGGKAYLVSGRIVGMVSLASASATLEGTRPDDHLGTHVAGLGDVNGDGFSDVAVSGAWRSGGDLVGDGAAYLVYGPVAGTRSLPDADATFLGDAGDGLGILASAGDIDADGLADLLVGAPRADYGGRSTGVSYLYLGR